MVSKAVADASHPGGVPVEAELGKVGGKEDDLDGGEGDPYTDPQEAAEKRSDSVKLLYCLRVISREVFCHIYGKIPRHTGQNAITEGDLECILTKLL